MVVEWDLMGFNGIYPLVNIQKTSKNYGKSPFSMENPIFPWSFSIAMLNYQRVRSDKLTYHAQLLVSQKCLQTSWAKALLSHHILPKRPRRFMSATQAKRHPKPRSKHPKAPASLSFERNFRSSLLGNSRTSPFLALLDQTRLFKYPISTRQYCCDSRVFSSMSPMFSIQTSID